MADGTQGSESGGGARPGTSESSTGPALTGKDLKRTAAIMSAVFAGIAAIALYSICGGKEEKAPPATPTPPAQAKAPPAPSPPAEDKKPVTADPAVLGSLVNPCGASERCWLLSPSRDEDPVLVVASPQQVDAAKRDHLMSGADFALWQLFQQEIHLEKYAGLSDEAMVKKIAQTEAWARGKGKKLADTMFSAKGLVIAQGIQQGKLKDQRTPAERDAAAKLSASEARAYHATLEMIARAGLRMTQQPDASSCMDLLRKYQPLAKKTRTELDAFKIGLGDKYGYLTLAAGHGVNCPVCLKSGEFDCKQMLKYLVRRSVNID